MKLKPRTYKLKRNAEKRMRHLQAENPERRFWVAPTQDFKYAVFTTRIPPADDPNAIAVICA